MNLPNANRALVDRRKIADYLLCPSHPDGGTKARFFFRFGFRREEWRTLADALREHAKENPVTETVESSYGKRYTVSGPLSCPDGRRPFIETVWIVEAGLDIPRLITAYPTWRSQNDQGA